MKKRLLSKTTNYLLLFSVVVLLISAPVFYLMTDALYIEETDETLELHKEEFTEEKLPTFRISDISSWNKYNRNVKILADRGLKSQILFDTVYYDKLENENEPYRQFDAPITIEGTPFTYSEKINLIERRDMVAGTVLMFSAIIVILLAGMLFITKVFSKKMWKPFYDTLAQIQDFELDKSKRPQFPVTEIGEFSQLNNSLGRLIEKNTEIYHNQKEFVENAAHELQTPLALFQAKIDNLYQMNLPGEYSLILNSLNDDVARLNRLNKNLLLLSKIGNANDSYFGKQRVLLNESIRKNLDFFIEQAHAKNIEIVTGLTEKVRVMCNPDLAEVMINNLFLNAIRHNVKGGKIFVTLADDAVAFLNTGEELPLDAEKMFRRFAKSGASSKGNGLGLAIVKNIVEVNRWSISYTFKDNLHGFTINF
jgi:signal transduction histidine kinase